MKVNKKLSSELRATYNHQNNRCYENATNLIVHKEVESFVIGLCTCPVEGKGIKVLIRHAWGIKDGQIVDTTLDEQNLDQTCYYEIFRLEGLKEFTPAIVKHKNPMFSEYNIEKEEASIKEIEKMTGLEYVHLKRIYLE